MTFIQPYLWRPVVLCGLALALGACGTTYGTGTNPGAQTVKDLTGMLSFGAGKSSAPIAYEARPPIVTPPNTNSLPAPGSGATVQNWPNDPDVMARQQQIANASKKSVDSSTTLVDPGFRLPKQKVVPYKEETVDEQVLSLTANKKEQQKLMATAKGGSAGQVDANGNPIRTALTEPPAEYRIPDPTAPEEFEATSKRGLGSMFKKKKDDPRPSEMGGGTDDIDDPATSTDQ